MVRLVFRPYTQVGRSICTSESLRASTRVSSGFTLFRHSSPSFGSQQMRSYSNLPENRIGRSMMRAADGGALTSRTGVRFTFIAPASFLRSRTRAHVRLLGPCFKTGRTWPFRRQRPWHILRRPRRPRPAAVAAHCTQSTAFDDRPEGRGPSLREACAATPR